MAPRRAGGYGSGGYSLCAGLFTSYWDQVSLGYSIVFIIIYIGISIALCCVRKRDNQGRKLIGLAYVAALFSTLFSFILGLVNSIVVQCSDVTTETFNGLNITSNVLYYLGIWGLLFAVTYKLNNMLRKQLGAVGMIYKAVPLALLGIMAALFVAQLALSSYVSVGMNSYYYHDNLASIAMITYRLRIATMVVYLVMVLISAVLAGMTISALRTRRLPAGDLIGWVAVLYFSMVTWSVFAVASLALSISADYLDITTSYAISFVLTFFQALSFLVLLGIAKHACWNANGTFSQQVYAPVMQQQTAYGYGSGQSDYYQQPPALVHAK
ncbi:hypothetical protein DDE83_007566 [Stemphylium lycopersici]|uniref:Uncharacterized protein n=1 Tax=Stemphylium lycopersici TaxID=183478 RepID=A0A364MVP0_STELY|nr:hypothetical protein DDE83_007566 [Stemphylium lycopersici]